MAQSDARRSCSREAPRQHGESGDGSHGTQNARQRLSKTIWPSPGVCYFQLSWLQAPNYKKEKKIVKWENPLPKGGQKKIIPEAARCCPRRPCGHAFLDKYRPGSRRFKITAAREGETESLRVPTRPAPGGGAAAKGSADTWCAGPAAGARAGATRRGAAGRRRRRGRGGRGRAGARLTTGPAGGRTRTDAGRGQAGSVRK